MHHINCVHIDSGTFDISWLFLVGTPLSSEPSTTGIINITRVGEVYEVDKVTESGAEVEGIAMYDPETNELFGALACTVCVLLPNGSFGSFRYTFYGDSLAGAIALHGKDKIGFALHSRP